MIKDVPQAALDKSIEMSRALRKFVDEQIKEAVACGAMENELMAMAAVSGSLITTIAEIDGKVLVKQGAVAQSDMMDHVERLAFLYHSASANYMQKLNSHRSN